MSDVSAAMDRAASTWRILREATFSIRRKWMAWPQMTRAFSAIPRDSLSSNPIEGKYYDWAVGYRIGLRLQDFCKLEDCRLGETSFYYFPDCTAHKNPMQANDFAQSVMYRHGITCSSCHDAHGTENYAQLRKPANQICLDCHAPAGPNFRGVVQGVEQLVVRRIFLMTLKAVKNIVTPGDSFQGKSLIV
jgi:predicted CXXCH cytochrome family protein